MATKEEKKLAAEAKAEAKEAKAEVKAEAKAAEAEAEIKVKNKKKIQEEFYAGKLVLEKYKKDGGKFVVLEGGDTIKL